MADSDYIVVGSGINGLVCAAMLGLKGRKVLLLERNDRIGGCLRTEAVTAPGFVHDVMATTFVLFVTSPAYAVLGPELEARGLAFAQSDIPTGVLRPDGSHLVLTRSRETNRAAFEAAGTGDGAAFDREMGLFGANAGLVFSVLGGQLWSRPMLKTLAGELWRRGPRGFAAFLGEALVSARAHLEGRYTSDLVRALFAPWVLHTGLGPESAYSGEMVKVIGFALEAAGAPIVKGGVQTALDAFARLIRDKGGSIETGADVVTVSRDAKGKATGVVLADGRSHTAQRGVICSVSPDASTGACWPARRCRPTSTTASAATATARATCRSTTRWRIRRAGGAARTSARSRCCISRPGSTACPRPPTRPSAGCCRPSPRSASASRRRSIRRARRTGRPCSGCSCPRRPAPSRATPRARSRPGRRALDRGDPGRLCGPGRGDPGPPHRRISRAASSPGAPIRRPTSKPSTCNLVGGDPYGGYCGVDQFFLWRPFKGTVNHRTPVPNLYHIGAATHPGPGLGGGSGFLLAKSLS